MTMWANIMHGLGYGWAGIILSAWPPVALMAAVEVLARMVRPAGERGGAVPAAVPAPATVPADVEQAARVAYRATVAAGNPLSERQVAGRFGMTRPQAKKIMASVAAESNAHGPAADLGASR